MNLKKLSSFIRLDEDKTVLIEDILHPKIVLEAPSFQEDKLCIRNSYDAIALPEEKYCPKCNRKYPKYENFCLECAVKLKNIEDKVKVRDIKTNPKFTFEGENVFDDFTQIFSEDNFTKINEFVFSIDDYNDIIKGIKRTSLKTMDDLIRSNELFLDELDVLDSVLLFAKSFITVDYKSYGQELGYFEFDRITVDDRQSKSLQITTLIHELSHFLLKEIITQIICRILDCTKNSLIEAISIFILSYLPFTKLIDEYAAHTVEGRFSLYGYQDYSSFLQIEKSFDGEMDDGEIEITKSIGNTFAISIKDILESFIDDDLREDIKSQFEMETSQKPNYEMLRYENCNKLTDEGLIRAIWIILTDGFTQASLNIEKLEEYKNEL